MESDALTWGDKLMLWGLSFHGFHGAKPEERTLGQKFFIDIDAWMDLKAAGKSDHLSDTVCYTEEIYDIAKEVLEGSPHNLLESLAQKIAITITNHKEISAVRVKVGKPHVYCLGVEILRRRSFIFTAAEFLYFHVPLETKATIIANLDLKLDFLPPTLLNFISRQLIGSGFRLYQKAVTSMMGNDKDKDFSKALEDTLYVRIHEALLSTRESKAMAGEELKQDASIVPTEELVQSEDEAKDVTCEDSSNQCSNNYIGETLDAGSEEVVEADCKEILQIEEDVNKVLSIPIEEGNSLSVLMGKENGEIVETDSEEIVEIEMDVNKMHDLPVEEDGTKSVLKDRMNAYIRSDVRNALETIERVISVVRECGFHSLGSTLNSAGEEFHCMENGGTVDSDSAKVIEVCLKNEVSVKVSSSNMLEENLEEPGTIQSFRHTGTNANKEVNYKKVVPASPEQNLSRPMEANQADSYSLKNGTTLDQTIYDNKQLNSDAVQDMSSDDLKKSTREIKYRYCCFMH
ncbi:Dihydroneopterin aldolase [Glycine soja]|nr:Dihydroneopterin aldolase [Glycine soja]